jgi:ribosomal subunit interface protein
MQINISGQHLSIGSSLSEHVNERLNSIVEKYFANAPSAHVHFSKRGSEFCCDIVLHEGTGRRVVIKSNNVSDEIYSTFDIALSKLEKQMRKYRSKLNNHHRGVKASEVLPTATKYVISSEREEDEAEFDVDNPAIIAEKPAQILPLSVGEAVMKMDLENLPALMFENAKTGRINVVYYRKDGNISWVDSE